MSVFLGEDYGMKLGLMQPIEECMELEPFSPSSVQEPVNPFGHRNTILSSRTRSQQLCDYFGKTHTSQFLRVISVNDYTCAMIEVSMLPGIPKSFFDKWSCFCMSVYQGIVNSDAILESTGLVISERSSFLHSATSLAPCKHNFRISPGIIDEEQLLVLVNALVKLEQFVKATVEALTGREITSQQLHAQTGIYQPKAVKSLNLRQGNIAKLFERIRRTNMIKELTRDAMAQVSLGNAICNFLVFNQGCAWTDIIQEIVENYWSRAYDISDSVSFNQTKASELNETQWQKTFKPVSKEWGERAQARFGKLATKLKGQQNTITLNSELYRRMGEDVFSKAHLSADEGYGSSSEEEIINLSGCKVVMPTGMRAIVVACCALVMERKSKFRELDYTTMYYEFADLIGVGKGKAEKRYSSFRTKIYDDRLTRANSGQGKLYLIDKNHCVNTLNFTGSNFPTVAAYDTQGQGDAYIWDVTGFTESEMATIVHEMLNLKSYPFTLLVDSGLKTSFDLCNTGSVKIFAKTKELARGIREKICLYANTPLTVFTNQMRRTVKYHFGTPRIKRILSMAVFLNSEFIKSIEPSGIKYERKKLIRPGTLVKADNNCLFRAVASQVLADTECHHQLRQAAVSYMHKHLDYFGHFNIDQFYLMRMRQTDHTWGGDPEINALAGLLGVNITVYNPDDSIYMKTDVRGATQTVNLYYCNAGEPTNLSAPPNHYNLKRNNDLVD